MTKIGPNMGHTFYFIWNQGKPESVFDRIKEVRKMVKTTSNLCNNTNWNIWENPWTKFEEENLWNLNWKCCHVKIGKICYYPGFYSSRNDEMGPNGVHFSMRSEIITLAVKLIKFHTMSSNMKDSINVSKWNFI